MSIVEQFTQKVEAEGVVVYRELHGFRAVRTDLSLPFIVLTICLRGEARALCDLRETVCRKNDLTLVMPGHVLRLLDCSPDYAYAQLAISKPMLDELRNYLFSHDYAKFHYHPVFSLTDLQVERLLTLLDQLAIIASHSYKDLKHRNHILLAQMSVGYEYLNYYCQDQYRQLEKDAQKALYAQFCDLVVEHHREHKDILFYAEKMKYHPKYLSRAFTAAANGITPKEWIERFVMAQAKRLMATNPKMPISQIARILGYYDPTAFYRSFKRVTGITAYDYRRSVSSQNF